MADGKEPDTDRQKYVKDPRIACKYGSKCYQKNPIHQEKYKHPPPKRNVDQEIIQPNKKFKMDSETPVQHESMIFSDDDEKYQHNENEKHNTQVLETQENQINDRILEKCVRQTPKEFKPEVFIEEKFLVRMPKDFYQFWDFCKELEPNHPEDSLRDIGLSLVGPYDVLAGKFYNVPDQPKEKYLIHWRYYHDPPEFQTVLKGDDRRGFHIGYFRDSPKELPIYLASNSAKTDGVFRVRGDNIFSAVNLYLDDLKKAGDPFKKMHIGKIQNTLKKKAEELQLNLAERSERIKSREKKIVTRTLSKMGIVVPYNRKTHLGYRDLGVSNKKLVQILDNIQKASPDQKLKFLSELQNVLTNVTIATDECDFGTGIELGLNIIAHGVEGLNDTAARVLSTSYRLIGKEEFAEIAEAHMRYRRKDLNLSII